jgi:antitoxin MazE
MKTSIRKIGNSKGFIIPASFLAQTGVADEVEMTIKDQSIIITPIKPNKRVGWFDNYEASHDHNAWEDIVALASEQEEWEW